MSTFLLQLGYSPLKFDLWCWTIDMKHKFLEFAFAIFLIFLNYLYIFAQSDRVSLKFEIEGKECDVENVEVLIHLDNKIIKALVDKDILVVPEELKSYQECTVQIIFQDYSLVFGPINVSDFDSRWVIGVDKSPFESRYAWKAKETTKKVLSMSYLEFHPKNAEGTVILVKKYK